MNANEITQPQRTDVLATRAEEARDRLHKANRRLTRAGITEFFTWTETPGTMTVDRDGVDVKVEIITFEVNRPAICYQGWQFMASVDFVEGGVVVNTVAGLPLGDLPRPEDHHCDHCETDRYRRYTYLLRHTETGEVVQVGKTCLELFLGVRPSALWVLGFDIGELNFGGGSGFAREDVTFPTRSLLKLGWLAAEEGADFVSRKKAREDGGIATVDLVNAALLGDHIPAEPRLHALVRKAMSSYETVDEALVDDLIATGMNAGGDYGANLQAVLSSENVPSHHFPLLISVIGVYLRERDRRNVRKGQTVSSGFLAEVGEKVSSVPATILTLREVYSAYGYSTLLVAQTPEGHLIKWFGKVPDEVGGVELEEGQKIVFATATVKAHEEYGGNDQTRVVRARLTRPADFFLQAA